MAFYLYTKQVSKVFLLLAMKAWWTCSSTHSSVLVLDGGEWSTSHTSYSDPEEKSPGTYWIGGCVGY
jgi:hypothetical protein